MSAKQCSRGQSCRTVTLTINDEGLPLNCQIGIKNSGIADLGYGFPFVQG